MKYIYFRDKDDEGHVNLWCCPHAQTLPQSSLQSAPSSKYLCADTIACWNHRTQRWCLHQHFSRREFENIVGIYFLFFAAAREFHIYEESHAPGRGNVICRTTASVASSSLLVSNVCMYIRALLHNPHFATFWQESYRRLPECSCQCLRMTWSKL